MSFVEANEERVEALAAALAHHGAEGCELALVLGSGLGAFAEQLTNARIIPCEEIDGMPASSVPGHAGRIVIGEIGGKRVLVQQGRVHLYEGLSVFEVTRAVRAFARLGVRGLVLTNAAGGLNEAWPPGTLMCLSDHVNRQGCSPLYSRERQAANPYDAGLAAVLEAAAERRSVRLERGVYVGLPGPSYETPAEVRMLRWMGADAVGMSTVAEASAAFASGMRVCAISCITNHAAGISKNPLSHDEVVETGRAVAEPFAAMLAAATPEMIA